MHFTTNNSRGFTLVEIIVAIVLVGTIAGIAAMIILQGTRSYSDEQSRSDIHYQARLATERIAREVRLVRSCADVTPTVNPSTTLTFTDINGAGITFSRTVGNDLMRNADVVAQNVTALQISYLDISGTATASPGPTCGTAPTDTWLIQISLTVTDPQTAQSVSMLTRVYPRNF
jgi:prepilin-type N-terminal cleavage/methylation domain-containing protein